MSVTDYLIKVYDKGFELTKAVSDRLNMVQKATMHTITSLETLTKVVEDLMENMKIQNVRITTLEDAILVQDTDIKSGTLPN